MIEVAPPTFEPLSPEEVRVHLRIENTGTADAPAMDPEDLAWITPKITAARQWAEQFLGFPLSDAVYVAMFSAFATPLVLPLGTAYIVSVQYVDTTNDVQTVDDDEYDFDAYGIALYPDPLWPTGLSTRSNAVRVLYKARFTQGDSAAEPPVLPLLVPESIKHAMLLLIGHWYENREASIQGTVTTLPLAVESLLRPYRTRFGMA